MVTPESFRFIIAKIYDILRYVIPRILRHMYKLHIKETEISHKRSKGIKNWKITYSVVLSVISNKTNLILEFSSPLKVSRQRYHLHAVTPTFSTYSKDRLKKRFGSFRQTIKLAFEIDWKDRQVLTKQLPSRKLYFIKRGEISMGNSGPHARNRKHNK